MDIFEYIAVLTSIIIGLGIAHLLHGVARTIQRPDRDPVYWVHLVWVGYVFLTLVFWWWWEFHLGKVGVWTFQIYLFVVLYAVSLFLSASVLYPDTLEGYKGYDDYFYSRRTWFFGLLAISYLTDIPDSLVKGADYWQDLGFEYHVISILRPALCSVAMWTRNRIFHGSFAIGMLVHQISWALRQYGTVE
jgi:hypothetical protein